MKRIAVFLHVFVLSSSLCGIAGESLVPQVKAAMKKATSYFRSISTNGGYAGIYSLDLSQRYGEALYEKAKSTEIWVQPPGTPSVGRCFLRAYRITGDGEYLEAAREAGKALAWGQRKEGGWDHRVDVSHLRPDADEPVRMSGRCTFDDDITQGALTFLIELDDVLDERWLSESIELGLDFVLESQFENGAWPQWYPLIGGYHDYYTFNDNAINDCIRVLMKAHEVYGKKEYLEGLKLGGDFIILSQMPKPQAGWAQQYSHDMKPAWARKFEPPAVCSAVTARNIRTLVDIALYTKDEKYLSPIPAALRWLEESKTGENLWARLYEVGTNKPIYGDRDGKVHYTLDEISEERRRGYSWHGSYGIPEVKAYYEEVKSAGLEGYGARRKPGPPDRRRERIRELVPEVRELLDSLDEKGRWVDEKNELIYSRDFVRNFNRLCDYLEAAE